MLADVAAFLGLTPPAASKLVDGLVTARLLTREIGAGDRRRVALKLNAGGRRIYQRAVESSEQYLAAHFAKLEANVRGEVLRAMQALRSIFDDPPEVRSAATDKKNTND